MKRRLASLIAVAACLTVPGHAMEPIPQEGGFSGYVNVGVGYAWIKNSGVAGNKVVDLDNATIDSLGEAPDVTSRGLPALGFNLAYTFETSRSQVTVGNVLEDFLRFEAAAQLAFRKQFGEEDIVSAGLLFSSPRIEVYADPYVVGAERDVTSRSTSGARLAWDRILGSRLEVEFTFRNIEIEDERSGAVQLALPASQRDLLDRSGRTAAIHVLYTFSGGDGAHTFIPSISWKREDLDGAAMAGDIIDAQITYRWNGRRLAVSSALLIGSREGDEPNPIFGETMDHDALGASIQVFYKKFCGVEGLSLLAMGATLTTDSSIDFYEAGTTLASLGIFYRF